jgi:hypothetical protein
MPDHRITFNTTSQILLPVFTLLGFLLISLKYPQYGLIASLIAQIFWIYSSYQAWRKANQLGIFITTIFMTVTIVFGILNYWVL